MSTYDHILSALPPHQFEPPLQPLNVPVTLPQISAYPLQPLTPNIPHPLSGSLQGRDGRLILPSVVHTHDPLLTALLLRKGVPPLLPTNVTATLAQLSNLLLQQGEPYIQPLDTNPSPNISALSLQRYMLPLQPSALRSIPPLISVLLQGRGVRPPAPSAVCAHAPLLSASLTQRVKIPIQPSAVKNLPFPQILALPLSMHTGFYQI